MYHVYHTTATDSLTVSSDFDIFAHKPIQTSGLETIETVTKTIAPGKQSDLEFLILSDTYIDLDIKLNVRGKLISGNGERIGQKNITTVEKSFFQSLFSQCNITRNGVRITQSGDLYQYRPYLETLLTYGSDAPASHLTNSFRDLGRGDMLLCNPSTANKTAAVTNVGFITRSVKLSRVGKSSFMANYIVIFVMCLNTCSPASTYTLN